MLAAVVLAGGGGAGVIALLGGFAGGGFLPSFGGLFGTADRPDLIWHTARPEYLAVTVVERGTLESGDNKDVVCRVKAGSRGTFSSTIKWVIDDGTEVKKGQLLMELDDSALQESYRDQTIRLDTAKAAWVTADENLTIAQKQSELDVATAQTAVRVAELDLDKFLGVRADDTLEAFGGLGGAAATLVERGEYRRTYDDVSGRLKLAESDLEAYRDRASWADRAVRLGYLTASQSKVEQSKLASALDNLEKLRKERYVLETFQRQKDLTTFQTAVEVKRLDLERLTRQGRAKEVQAEAEKRKAYSVFQQEFEKLQEIEQQIRLCKITSPGDGMAVYYKSESSRFSSSQQGMIAVGEQVREGQKLMRIPDLSRIQVNTKVHEALVSRLRPDDRQPTWFLDKVRAGMLAIPSPMARLASQSEFAQNTLQDGYRAQEYYLADKGQRSIIRVDAFPNKVFVGRVRTVAAVASQTDFFSSDVKVYQTMVRITGLLNGPAGTEDEDALEKDLDLAHKVLAGLKPDMSAEVTIQVDPPSEKVLCVPVQAVVGGAEGGASRKVFVRTPAGPEERAVKLGGFNEKMVEVREGLADGDEVVLNPKVLVGDKSKTREEEVPAARRGPTAGGGADKSKAGGATKSKTGTKTGTKPPMPPE